MSNEKPQEVKIPTAVRSSATFHVTRLIDHAYALEATKRAYGNGHLLSLELMDRKEAIRSSYQNLNDIYQHALKNQCASEFMELVIQAGLPDLTPFGFEPSDAPSWAHLHPVDEFPVIVVVTGKPSDPEDEDLPGTYSYVVRLSRKVKLSELTDHEKSEVAKTVLDEFHNQQGIEEIDDLDIQVVLPNSTAIAESDDHVATDLVASVQ